MNKAGLIFARFAPGGLAAVYRDAPAAYAAAGFALHNQTGGRGKTTANACFFAPKQSTVSIKIGLRHSICYRFNKNNTYGLIYLAVSEAIMYNNLR